MDPEQREDTVRLLRVLGDAWLREPDDTLLARLALLPPLEKVAKTESHDELAVAYAELILQLVPPYASMFLSDSGMLNAEPAEEALRAYSRAGFEIPPEWRAGAADHLGVELHFLAELIGRGSPLWQTFLADHILTWAPVCCLAVERAAVNPLYTDLAVLTRDVLLSLDETRATE